MCIYSCKSELMIGNFLTKKSIDYIVFKITVEFYEIIKIIIIVIMIMHLHMNYGGIMCKKNLIRKNYNAWNNKYLRII